MAQSYIVVEATANQKKRLDPKDVALIEAGIIDDQLELRSDGAWKKLLEYFLGENRDEIAGYFATKIAEERAEKEEAAQAVKAKAKK